MVNLNRFYTYAYLREDGTPYYIGKGSGNRIYDTKGRPCNKPIDKSRIIFLKQNLTEEEAFRHEKYMIDVFGRKDLGTGILLNKTNGGDGSSGVVKSVETRKRIAKNSEGRKWWNDGCGNSKFVEECPGEGWVPGMKEETKNKMGRQVVGTKYWNDGCGNTVRSVKCPGEGWVLGIKEETLKRRGEVRKGKKYWNDGCGNIIISVECPGEGWVCGMGGKGSELKRKSCKKTNSQKWICLETGHITTSGPLTNYQRKRGIDTSKRKRVD